MIKKFLLILALFTGVVVAMTMTTESEYKTGIGKPAPQLHISAADREIKLDEQKGDYVLLSFWTSTDAASRVATSEYNNWVAKHPEADVSYLSVNFDRSEKFFREIVKRDGLNSAFQYHVSGDEAEAIRYNYALKDGYGTVLINPDGKIVAHNPTVEELDRIFV